MSWHTPAPWMLDGVEVRAESSHPSEIPICEMQPGYNYDDALLIAAAPDLLEALEALLADAPATGLMSVYKARAAIARAKGLTSS